MTNKTIEANKKLAKIMEIKKELMTVFAEVEFQATKHHNVIFICDGVEIAVSMMQATKFAATSAMTAFIMKTGEMKNFPSQEKLYFFKQAYVAGLVKSGKDYKKLSQAKLEAMVAGI